MQLAGSELLAWASVHTLSLAVDTGSGLWISALHMDSLWLWTQAQDCGSLYSAHTLSGSAHGLSRVAHRPQSSPASVVAASRLSCPTACGVLAPRPESKPKTSALQGRFLTTGPPGWSPKAKWFTLNVDGCPEDPT